MIVCENIRPELHLIIDWLLLEENPSFVIYVDKSEKYDHSGNFYGSIPYMVVRNKIRIHENMELPLELVSKFMSHQSINK